MSEAMNSLCIFSKSERKQSIALYGSGESWKSEEQSKRKTWLKYEHYKSDSNNFSTSLNILSLKNYNKNLQENMTKQSCNHAIHDKTIRT